MSKIIDMRSRAETDASVPAPLVFEEQQVRIVWQDGAPWFVAADICAVLGLSNPTVSVRALDDDERAKSNLGRQGEATVISESGFYTLILRCRGATTPGTLPHRFRKWVTGEVLPALRRTGQYAMPKPRKPKAAPAREHMLHAIDRGWWNAQLARTGLSQRKIARELGMDHAALSLALNGKRHLRFQEALALADILGITVDDLRAQMHLPQPRLTAQADAEDIKILLRAVTSIADSMTMLMPVLVSRLRPN